MTERRERLNNSTRWVVKIGSALLTNEGFGLKAEVLDAWITQIHGLRQSGKEVVLVSSGAIAEGLSRLGWSTRPKALHDLQAAAAVGQMGLIQAWEQSFQRYGTHTAQVLLTSEDVSDRRRYLNARSTLRTLIKLGIVPIVNENDTVATDEIQLGDNDTLAGLVANLIEADVLVILTDQAGLYDRDPRKHADAVLIESAKAGDRQLEDYAGEGGMLGRGGMRTKLMAAAIAARSGADTIIASGSQADILNNIATGENVGTFLRAARAPVAARKQWLAGHTRVRGKLILDQGAVRVLREQGKSLLAVGVTGVEGAFRRGEIVACCGADGREVARGLVNYNNDEARIIAGEPSERIEELLGYVDEAELIHRDNLILI